MKYRELYNEFKKDIDAVPCDIILTNNKEQFERQIEAICIRRDCTRDDLISRGYGLFYTIENNKKFEQRYEQFKRDLKAMYNDFNFLFYGFLDEMHNTEYVYTRDQKMVYGSLLFTKEEFEANETARKAFTAAENRYLNEVIA